MKRLVPLLLSCAFAFPAAAADQLTVHKVQLSGPSGSINGKVVGVGDYLVFVDDDEPSKSFLVQRGEIRTATANGGAITVQMARPVTDRHGTRSNLEIRVIDPASHGVLSKWIGVAEERGRTETTISLDVKHDHKGQGHCMGKLLADDTRLRFESVSEAAHSQAWNYNELSGFEGEREYALLKVNPKSGEAYHFNVANGATAGAMYRLVAQKIVSARPTQ